LFKRKTINFAKIAIPNDFFYICGQIQVIIRAIPVIHFTTKQFKKMVQQELLENGFALVENLFTENEIKLILQTIDNQQNTNAAFNTNGDLFAIRCFLQQFSELQTILMNDSLKTLLASFGVKSIYFDKPIRANWVVNWHQDLTISVQNKVETEGFTHWLPKQNYFSVQQTIEYLENMVTIRIHLDDCTQQNGALRVIPKSHQTIQAIKNLPNPFFEEEQICEVAKGGALIMKPLIWAETMFEKL
jgi:ectoine hydroxylase-related dioxygenase (phytanoyl-CoA dioxygenase family)